MFECSCDTAQLKMCSPAQKLDMAGYQGLDVGTDTGTNFDLSE